MADDLSKRGGRDRERININQDYELRDWAKKFGVTTERLKAAVRSVGDDAKKVEENLKGGGKPS
jgi:Protein of unknown function (DUF3606)